MHSQAGICSSHEGSVGSQSAERDRNQGHGPRERAASGPGGSPGPRSIYFSDLSNLSEAANWSPINQIWPTDEFYWSHTFKNLNNPT